MTNPNINAPNVWLDVIPLDAILNQTDFVITPGTRIYTLYIVLPAGVYAELWINGRFRLALPSGTSSWKTDIAGCPAVGGYSLKTYQAYPGLSIQMFSGSGVQTA